MDFCFGLCGCSNDTPRASEHRNSVPAAQEQRTELEGIGSVLSSFQTVGELFDIDFINPGNKHNESNVETSCYPSIASYFMNESFARDETLIEGKGNGGNYDLSVTMNSESGTLMWSGDVTTHFHYDAASKTWDMSSGIVEDEAERIYAYCDPAAVFDTLIAGLECYAATSGDTAEAATIKMLTESIKEQRGSILASGLPLYSDVDCEQQVDRQFYASRWDGMMIE